MWAYGHFDVNKTMIVFSVINYKLTYVVTKTSILVRCMFMLLCPVLSFNYVFEPCCAWIFDQSTLLVFSLLSNQRLLECSCLIMFLWHASAWICDQRMVLVFLFLSNQRLLEGFCGIIGKGIFMCFGDMCSLPSHPCHSSCTCSCCEVLFLYNVMHVFWPSYRFGLFAFVQPEVVGMFLWHL